MTSTTPNKQPDPTPDPHEVKTYFINVFSELGDFFTELKTIETLVPSKRSTEEAVVSITIGQMLSRKAAATIFERVNKAKERGGYGFSMELPEDILINCGISQRKVRTIKSFFNYWKSSDCDVSSWQSLDYEQLALEVKKHVWGFADWSISMLAIFYFAHHDVFPLNDGTLKKALALIKDKYRLREELKVEKASPFSSYLALYLWQAIDDGHL